MLLQDEPLPGAGEVREEVRTGAALRRRARRTAARSGCGGGSGRAGAAPWRPRSEYSCAASAQGASRWAGPVPPPDRVLPQRRAGAVRGGRRCAACRVVVGVPVVAPRGDDEGPAAVLDHANEKSTSLCSCSARRPSSTFEQCESGAGRQVAQGRPHLVLAQPARSSGRWVVESGWLCSPAVQTNRCTSRSAAAAVAIRPPAPKVSSSGWAATTRTWSKPSSPPDGTRSHSGRSAHALAGVPGPSWLNGLTMTGPALRARLCPARRRRAPRGAGARRRAGRRRGWRARPRRPAERVRGRGRRRGWSSSTASATTCRTRRASSAPTLPFGTAAVDLVCGLQQHGSGGVQRASTVPRWAQPIWSGSRSAACRRSRRAMPTAPPYQTAATPMPPQAKPSRSEVPARSADQCRVGRPVGRRRAADARSGRGRPRSPAEPGR